ncbi:MAG TPA: class I SAM-dependent methyltransferase [Bacteroidales bacterium]
MEIGVLNGGGLEIWANYFGKGEKFIGCDINPDCEALHFDDPRIALVVGDANSDTAQEEILSHSKALDIVIDDGSHQSGDVIRSFLRYFAKLVDGGIYVVEDLHTSYWDEYGGGLFAPFSSISFFKRLVDIINYEHWGIERNPSDILAGFQEKYGVEVMPEILEHIHSIKFVNSLCIILKSQPIDNKLGARILAGKFTVINSDVVKLQGSSLVPPLQDSNPWSARIRPPEEELPALELILQALTAQVAENEQAVQTLKAQVAEYKSAINDYINILGQKGIRINNLEILLESIYRSTSWKITRPIRDAKTFAQKILR